MLTFVYVFANGVLFCSTTFRHLCLLYLMSFLARTSPRLNGNDVLEMLANYGSTVDEADGPKIPYRPW